MNVAIGKLRPNPENSRIDLGDVSELVESIREFGILEPLVVSPDKGGYIVVCGHRRVAAAKKAGLKECPVVVRETDAKDRELIALTENVHRQNLTPIEEALAYARLMKTRKMNQLDVARVMKLSPATVSLRLALLRLPKEMIEAVHAGKLSVHDAVGAERAGRRAQPSMPAKFNAGRKSKCTLEGHEACDDTCEVVQLQRRRGAA